jgi:hypothetical protein
MQPQLAKNEILQENPAKLHVLKTRISLAAVYQFVKIAEK